MFQKINRDNPSLYEWSNDIILNIKGKLKKMTGHDMDTNGGGTRKRGRRRAHARTQRKPVQRERKRTRKRMRRNAVHNNNKRTRRRR
jgi:hypothetical protein